jgi:gluconolactonase
MPNGLCVSRDGSRLYVADSGADMGPEIGFDPNGPREVFVFDLKAGAVDGAGRLFARIDAGAPDGIRIDMDDCLWVAAGDGVRCYDPDGHWLGVIATPEIASNLCFGGRNGGDLLITLARSAYLVTAAESG